MLSICNVGVPAATGVGPKENKQLYDVLYAIFQEFCQISLDGRHVVSDQETALHAICQDHANWQFLCLRRFLVSLKRRVWNEEVGNLIRCRDREDFSRLCAEYEPRFRQPLEDPEAAEGTRSVKLLERVGLVMSGGRTTASNGGKWSSV
jgi:hypothetical protein